MHTAENRVPRERVVGQRILGARLMDRRAGRLLALCIVALCCLVFLWRVQLGNGFTLLTGVPYDGTIEVSILEHWYNVLRGADAWNRTAYFAPYPDTLGYNDGYFLYGLIYSLPRSVGLDPYLSSEIVNIVLRGAGVFGFYLLAVELTGLAPGFALAGAALFTVANSMYLHALHQQLLTIVLAPFLFWCGCRMWRALPVSALRSTGWGCAAALLYGVWALSAFYMLWFATLFGLLLVLCLLALALSRRELRHVADIVRHGLGPLLISGVALVLALVPFALVYLPKMRETGGHGFSEVQAYLPSPLDLLHLGRGNLLGGPLDRLLTATFRPGFPEMGEHTVGMPPLLLVMAGAGMIMLLRRPVVGPGAIVRRALALATILSFVLCLRVHGVTLWHLAYRWVPGASAIRVVSRDLLFLEIPVVLLAMIVLERLARRGVAVPVLLALTALLFAEEVNVDGGQGLDRPAWMAMLHRVPPPPPACRAFYMATVDGPPPVVEVDAIYRHNVDAMILAEWTGLPTINGISTFDPPDWELYSHLPPTRAAIAAYMRAHRLDGLCGLDLRAAGWTLGPPAAAEAPDRFVLTFGRETPGSAAPFPGDGWGAAEPEGRWTVGPEADLVFALPPTLSPASALRLTIDAMPYAIPGRPASSVTILWNDTVLSTWRPAPGPESRLSVTVPAQADGGRREVRLALRIAAPVSPASLGVSSDRRALGLFVRRIGLAPLAIGSAGEAARP